MRKGIRAFLMAAVVLSAAQLFAFHATRVTAKTTKKPAVKTTVKAKAGKAKSSPKAAKAEKKAEPSLRKGRRGAEEAPAVAKKGRKAGDDAKAGKRGAKARGEEAAEPVAKKGRRSRTEPVDAAPAKCRKGRKCAAAKRLRQADDEPSEVVRGRLRRVNMTRGGRRQTRVFADSLQVLKGSRESLLRQNDEIDRFHLERIDTDAQLLELERKQALIPFNESSALVFQSTIEYTRRFARPWTTEFTEEMAKAYYDKFRKPIVVTSAVRTSEQQAKLRRSNGNAAPVDGDTASSHLAGTTIDIGKANMGRAEREWINDYLSRYADAHLIEVADESRTHCYHIMVSPEYELMKINEAGVKPMMKPDRPANPALNN